MSTTGSTGPPATAPDLSLIYIISFLDLFAVSLIIPIFTTIYKSLDLDPITFGLVSSVYGLAQFLCNPIIGRLSDRYGRKSLLLLSFLGSAVGYLLLGAATTVWMLFLSRVVVGVVKQTLTIAQAWITDHCPHLDDRMRALGRLRTAMSLGFIVGPAAGGLLSARVGQMAPALVAALLYLADFVIVFFFVDERRQQHHPPSPIPLPPPPLHERAEESNSDEGGLQEDTSAKKKTRKASTGVVRQLQLVWEVFTRPKVGRLLLIKFMIHLAVAMGRANFGLFMLERFGLGPEGSSYMTSVMGVTGVVTGLVHAPLTRIFPHHALLVAAGLLLGLYNGVTAFTTSLALFVALQPVASLSHLVLSTSALASFSHAFDQREIGLAMGVAGSVNSIGDIVAPLLAGVLFNFVGLGGPRVISSLLIFIAFSLFVVLGATTTTNTSPSSSSSSSYRVLKSSTSPSSPTIDDNTKKE